MAAAFSGALVIGVAAYTLGDAAHKLSFALRCTARWSLLWFCLATYGGALTTLFGARFASLARRGRDFGLAFAAAHLVHIALAARLLYVSPEPFPRLQLVVFSAGVFCTYLLAALSLSSTLTARLGRVGWKIVRSVCVEYLAFAFAFDFVDRTLHGGRATALFYFPLLAAAVGGPLLRLAAASKRRMLPSANVAVASGSRR